MARPEPNALSSLLTPAQKRGLADQVAERLRDAILRGYFAPGQPLREEQLATTLQVSRGPVREALVQLEREGLVLVRPNRGASVARLSRADVEEVYSLRLVLERMAVQYAIRHATDQDFAAIAQVLREMNDAWKGSITEQQAAELDIRFHDLVYQAARHARLYDSWANLKSQIYVFLLARNVANPDFRDHAYRSHAAILDALQQRNENDAIQLIEDHLSQAYIRVMGTYDDTANGNGSDPARPLSPIGELARRRLSSTRTKSVRARARRRRNPS